ncbi:MAG: hypothetical protein ACYDHE_15075 [Candidatus Acidiferrales bacterium]
MGKASRRRQMKRAEFLSELALTDPARFSDEWLRRVESWAREAKQNISDLRDANGNTRPLNSELLRYADEQLAACGQKAYELEAEFTKECLSNEFLVAFASSVDGRSYRITNTRENCEHARRYRQKRSP